MTLRTRLSLALVALTAIGLAVAALVTYHEVGSFLVQRVDQELNSASQNPKAFFGFGGQATTSRLLPPGTWAQIRVDGGAIPPLTNAGPLSNQQQPKVPAKIPTGTAFTVSEPHYRAFAGPETNFQTLGGETFRGQMIVAIPMRDVDDTLHHLLLIELLVAIGVLIALALLAWWVVHLGLRPLEQMSTTAGAIAAGDLTRRVETADARTEVGQLGLALNSMLGQIEGAFAERTASEARLRRFVADAAHELRTPLTSIRGYAELFRRGASTRPDDLAKTMLRIEEGAARMGVLVEDLLLLARLDQGRPLEHDSVDLSKLTAAAVDDMRVISPDRPVVYESNGAVVVNGDEHRLRQVVANLLENARTHTPPTTPVEVRVGIAGDDAVIEVRDHGPGMAPEVAARVFERFWRADPSRARTSGGAGLGLSIVAAITQAHGGRAEVETAPGAGAAFRVWIPRVPPATNGADHVDDPTAVIDDSAASTTAVEPPPRDPEFERLPEVQAEP